jgi:succinate dehydrogenase / fumarate reductase iron-sulfur subunit
MMDRPLALQILRTTRREPVRTYWQDFKITIPEGAYVLDALEMALRQDSSLLFRHSCHHASCGSCGMRIQGRERLSCITPAFDVARDGVLRLEPLRNFPVVADLVVDTGALSQKMERVHARITEEDHGAQRFVNCIECGLCISACPIAATSSDYLGPAVLAAAQPNLRFNDVRSLVQGPDGVWRCHSAFECTEVCPTGVEPATAIMNLRKELLMSLLKRKGS